MNSRAAAGARTHCIGCGSTHLHRLRAVRRVELMRCGLCSLIFVAAPPVPKDLVEFYQYPRDTASNAVTMKRYDELLDQLVKFRSSNRLLDVGCGAGHFLSRAQRHDWEVHGTEIAASQCERLRGQGFDVFLGEFTAANWPNDFFDLVVMTEFLEHLPDPVPYLHEAHRILRPGGAIFVTTPNIEALTRRLIGDRWRVFAQFEHLTYFSPKTLEQFAQRAGFKTVSLQTTGIDPYAIWDGWRCTDGRQPEGHEERQERTHQLRQRLEDEEPLQRLKRAINRTLITFGLGDTIKFLGQKEPA